MENVINFETVDITLLLSERSVQQLLDIVDQHPDWSIEKMVANHPKNAQDKRLFSYKDARIILKRLHLLTLTQRRLHHTFTKQLDENPQQSIATVFPDLLFYIKHRRTYLQEKSLQQRRLLTSAEQAKVKYFDKFFSLAGPFLLTFIASFTFFFIGSLIFSIIFQANTLLSRIGMFFSFSALFFGAFFFLYSLKYYFTIALILSFSRGEEKEVSSQGFWGWLSRLFGISIEIESERKEASRVRTTPSISLQYDLESVQLERSPFVSIHVASFNEKRVIDRFLLAATSMEYDNYEVIVADDSNDETVALLEEWKKNPRIKISHRDSRTGFKGGALDQALKYIDPLTEFILVLDADFIPYPDAIVQFLKYFQSVVGSLDPTSIKNTKIAAVQGYQWHVLNKSENWITRGVRSEYAGSYVIERTGTEIYQGLKQISGSVYMIRRDLLDKFNWGSSITEDFELTLKLYEKGFKVLYTPYIQAPAEAVSTIKRLIRQRMRWAEGHSYNIRRMFWRLLFGSRSGSAGEEKVWVPSPLTLSEKLEFLYLTPYYLQSFFFILGTISWFLAEIVFRTRLPFWTEVWGWSLVVTNLFALPLMNMVGLFMEESNERDYLGLFSFVVLSYILAPFQAFASVKGFLEKEEGPWFRTPKTGKITDTFFPGRISRFINRLFGAPTPIGQGTAYAVPVLPKLAYIPSQPINGLDPQGLLSKRHKRSGFTRVIIFLIMFSVLTANFLPLFSLSPDSLPVFRQSDRELQLQAVKQGFSSQENPKFSLNLDPSLLPTKTPEKSQTLLSKWFGPHIVSASEPEIIARLWHKETTIADLEPAIQKNDSGKYTITLDPGRFFSPGRYVLETKTTRNGNTYTAYQDFSWGVLALNTKKSIYAPGETIDFGFGVLDSLGKTICDAELTLAITIPSEEKPITLSSNNRSIFPSGKCGANTVTNTPDYRATFKALEKEETYKLHLEALTSEGAHAIDDTLTIKQSVPFIVERSSYPTRIFPPDFYPVNITVTTNEDFVGNIVDTLPYSFEISKISGEGVSDHDSFVMPYSKTETQKVTWEVNWKKGDTHTLSYTIKFPSLSPEFYLAGPLQFKTDNNTLFKEARSWQIAADGNTQIRQEINIMNGIMSSTGTVNSGETVQLDTTQYSGTVTYYFEAIVNSAASNTGTIALRRSGTSTNDTSISVGTNTSYNRIRSSSFTPPSAQQTNYVATLVGDGVRTQNVKAARIIIIQNAASITYTETQIEVGNYETTKNNTSSSPLNSPKYWYYDSTKWDAAQTFYAEVTYISSNSSANVTVTLQEDNGSFGSWTDKITIVNAIANTSTTRRRSIPFTPTTGRNYRIAALLNSATNGKNYSLYNAKVIVDQGAMALDAVYSSRTSSGGLTYNHTVGTNANLLVVGTSVQDGNHANYNITSLTYNGTALTRIRFDEPAGNVRTEIWYLVNPDTGNHAVNISASGTLGELAAGSISFINAKTTGVPDANNGSTGSSSSPSTTVTTVANGAWTVSVVSAEASITASGTQTLRWGPLTDQSFENSEGASKIVQTAGATALGYTLSSGQPWALSAASFAPNSTANVTKLEAQYLLVNTKSEATGLQSSPTLWDSTEWSNVTNTYVHAIDVNQTGGTTTAVLQDIDNSNSNLTSSEVSSTNTISVQKLSSAITMPATGHMVDTNITVLGAETPGTVNQGSTVSPASTTWRTHKTASPFTYGLTLYTLPGSSTAKWNDGILDSAQIGVNNTAGTGTAQVSTLWMLVDYDDETTTSFSQTRLWSSGFELQSNTSGVEWETGSGTRSISTSTFRGGAAALRANPSSSTGYMQHPFRSDTTTPVYIRSYVRVATAPSALSSIIQYLDNVGGTGCSIRLNNNRTLELWDNNEDAQIGSDSSALSLDTWYRLELFYDDAGDDTCTGYINGSSFASGNAFDLNGGGVLRVGVITSTTADIYFDDIAVNDNVLPGPGKIIHLKPNATGDNSAWTGDNTDIDETTPDDATTFISENVTSDVEDVNLEDASLASTDVVRVVSVGVRFNSVDATSESFVTRVTAASGELDASRILVQVAPEPIPESYVLLLLLSPLLWFGIQKLRRDRRQMHLLPFHQSSFSEHTAL